MAEVATSHSVSSFVFPEMHQQVNEKLGYAKDYKYTPLEDDSDQEYLPAKLKGKKFL